MDMDWKAAISSEIFREYLKTAIPNIKKASEPTEPKLSNEEEKEIYESFHKLQQEIRSSPSKLATFRAIKEKLIHDDEYRARTKVAFIDAVMLLDLD